MLQEIAAPNLRKLLNFRWGATNGCKKFLESFFFSSKAAYGRNFQKQSSCSLKACFKIGVLTRMLGITEKWT